MYTSQLSHPEQWQGAALGSHSMVAVPAQLGLPAAYMLGTGELAKAVLAGEGDITLQGVQHNYGLAKLVGEHSLLMVQEPRHKVGGHAVQVYAVASIPALQVYL